jgi:hypothetical protein
LLFQDSRSEALTIALEKFDAVKKKTPMPTDKRIYKVLNSLQKHRQTNEIPVVSMVVDCAALVPLPMSMFAPQLLPSTSAKASVGNVKYALESTHEEFPFLFPFLQNLLTINEANGTSAAAAAIYGKQIFEEILKILQTLHQQLRMAPESIESVSVQALALMFMLRQFLAVAPTSDISWLKKACSTISTFKSWPLPYSKFATELLDMLEIEMRAPGTELRSKLMLEDPELLPTSHAQKLDENHVLQVHVLVDKEDPLSNTHQALFETVQSELGRKSSGGMLMIGEGEDGEEESEDSMLDPSLDPTFLDLTPAHLRIRMVTHIISCDFDLSDAKGPDGKDLDDPLNLASKTPEEMLALYEKALDIHEQAKTLPTEDPTVHKSESGVVGGICKLFREKLVSDLLQEIAPGHNFSPCRSDNTKSRNSDTRQSMNVGAGIGMTMGKLNLVTSSPNLVGEEVEEDDTEAPVRPVVPAPEGDVHNITSLSNSFTPLMPPAQFKFWQCKTAPISKPTAAQKTKSGYLYYKKECEQLIALVQTTIEKSPKNVKPVLKLVLMGSNLILHKYLCAFAAVYEENAALLKSVDFRIYVCPEGQNDLGRFLAWTDKWYQRHVFTPFATGVPLAPQYSGRETFPASLLDECEMYSTLPVNLLREMLQHYVRCAEHTEKIRVHDVQVWNEGDAGLRRLSSAGGLSGTKIESFADYEDDDIDLFNGSDLNSSNSGPSGGKKGKLKKDADEERMPVFGVVPSVRVPFITSMEIGILSQVEAYKFNMMKQSESLGDVLADKDFMKVHGGGEFPNLQVSYRASNLNQKAAEETKVITGEFLSISVSNIPEGIRGFQTSVMHDEEKFGTWSGLTMNVRRNKGKLKDMLDRKTKLTPLEAEKFIELMKSQDSFGIQSEDEESDPYVAKTLLVGTVSVQVTEPRDSFYILVDGALVGPMKKITVGPSGLSHAAGEDHAHPWEVPIQSFFPVAAFTRQEDAAEGGAAGA